MSQSLRLESNFINSISAEATRKSYQFCFEKYRQFVKGNLMTADRLVIENQIVDFLLSLKKRGLSFHSVKNYFCAIAHFYVMNDIILNRKKIYKFIDTDKKKHKNAGYATEQIHKLLDVCDERTKAIILLYASAGIRLAALPALKIGDLKIIFYAGSKLYQITVYQGYKEEYITFCTPECTKVIFSYLQYRERCGEILKPDAPLIREQFNTSDPFKVKYPKHVSLATISKILRLKIIQAGIIKVDHVGDKTGARAEFRKDVPLIHGFRKFFNTALMNADVNIRFKELLMGHSVKLDDVYYDKNSEKSQAKLLDEYSKAIDYLTINEENRLRLKVEKLTVEKSQMDKLQTQIDRLNQLVKQ